MPIVDARGRVFGRVNLFDALVGVFVVAVIPLGYGAYALFKPPLPVVTSVEPSTLAIGDNMKVVINGRDLRPYLRVSFDTYQGKSFLFASTTRAEVELNAMPPGTYDIVLYDNRQERARLPKALTLVEPPKAVMPSQVVIVGRFSGLLPEQVSAIKTGLKLSATQEILEAAPPRPARPKVIEGNSGSTIDVKTPPRLEVPAIVRLNCEVRAPGGPPRCFIGDVPVQPLHVVLVTTPAGVVPLQIDQIRSEEPLTPVRVGVRFSSTVDILAPLKVGDRDLVGDDNELASAPRIVSAQPVSGTERRVTLALDAQQSASGWMFQGDPLRVGRALVFRTSRYELVGVVTDISK